MLLLAVRTEAGLSPNVSSRTGRARRVRPSLPMRLRRRDRALSTLQRLAEAAGMRLEWRYEPKGGGLPSEALAEAADLAIHRAVAAKLAADPVGVLAHPRRNLSVMRRANEDGSADALVRGVGDAAWAARLRGVVEALVSHGAARSWDLRQVTPFAGVLSDEERRATRRRRPSRVSECDATSSSISSGARPVRSWASTRSSSSGAKPSWRSVPVGLPPAGDAFGRGGHLAH